MILRDKLLFTPGPLMTSPSVKQAMLRDAGSWEADFNAIVAAAREDLLRLAGVSRSKGWEAVLMQGSGTFGVEAVFQTCVPASGKVAVLVNGAYGERIVEMLRCARIDHVAVRGAEDEPNDPRALEAALAADSAITHVAMVHCETTTGILNPIEAVGLMARDRGKIFIVDAMSSFAGLPIDLEACGIDFLISSSNKCIEGTPGFSFVIAKRAALFANEGHARSLSLDLAAQLRGFERNGKFRYTPPTQVILAFVQALKELDEEGGVCQRHRRYCRNHQVLHAGMRRLGFQSYLKPEALSPIITTYLYPSADFNFDQFHARLSDRGFVIYPGKLTKVDTFRIATIGHLFPADFELLVAAMELTLREIS